MVVGKIINRINRNNISINGKKSSRKVVNCEWWNQEKNVGDYLAKVVCMWMLNQKGIDPNKKVSKTKHLLSIGSVISMGSFNATVWGSGIHVKGAIAGVFHQKKYRKYDIRAVRGPVTKIILEAAGYDCPRVFGDPAILMPKIYSPQNIQKKYNIGLVEHLTDRDSNIENKKNIHFINVKTYDYKKFINQIVSSEKVISSSLHGIILAEAYGVPAVFLNSKMDKELLKFYDWYLSTGRTDIQIASSLNEAIKMKPMKLPNLSQSQNQLLETFPYDLWND